MEDKFRDERGPTLQEYEAIDARAAAPDTRQATIDALVAALEAALAWDKRRDYPIPYAVRDPMNAALALARGEG